MLENLNFHFAFYDWLLVFMVTALGVFSAYTKDPQLKAVAATIKVKVEAENAPAAEEPAAE